MKIYLVNGRKVWLDENNVPAGAVAYGAEKKVEKKVEKKAEPAEVKTETKAKKAPANKARKAGSNK